MSLIRERVTWVWLGLMTLTAVTTWALSTDLFSPPLAVVGTFAIAAVKVRLVVLDFMELRNAPVPIRLAFEAWPIVASLIIVGYWFATPEASSFL